MPMIVDRDRNIASIFGANLRAALEKQGKTAYWLMKTLDATRGAIYPIVRGESHPSLGLAYRIAGALDTTVEELLKAPKKKSRFQT